MFSQARLKVISRQTLSRFPEYEMLPRTLDLDLLDPSFVEAAWKARDDMAGRIYGPLPHEKRAEIFRFLIGEIQRVTSQRLLSICLETLEMWREIEPLLGQAPDAYACCCGGFCTPDQPIMSPEISLSIRLGENRSQAF